jgi:hypothetical protein
LLGYRSAKAAKSTPETLFDEYNRLIADSDLSDRQRMWAESRWRDEALSMYGLSVKLRIRFTLVRTIAVFSTLVTPVAAGIGVAGGPVSLVSRTISVVLGVVAAAAVAIDQIMRDGVRWRMYRAVFAVLSREGWAFFNREGRYATGGDAERFAAFFAGVEQAIADREERYRAEVAGIVDQTLGPIPSGRG